MVFGDAGNDKLSGDLGDDLLFGGAGADTFAFGTNAGRDWVGDFNGAQGDRILIAPSLTYTLSTFQGQVVIVLSDGSVIGLAGVGAFDTSWITFGV